MPKETSQNVEKFELKNRSSRILCRDPHSNNARSNKVGGKPFSGRCKIDIYWFPNLLSDHFFLFVTRLIILTMVALPLGLQART